MPSYHLTTTANPLRTQPHSQSESVHNSGVIEIDDNDYAKHLVETAPSDPTARRYEAKRFGPDPHAKELEKKESDTWAVAPVSVKGMLVGQIAADASRSQRPITQDALDYLTILASLYGYTFYRVESDEKKFLSDALHNVKTVTNSLSGIVDLVAKTRLEEREQQRWLLRLQDET